MLWRLSKLGTFGHLISSGRHMESAGRAPGERTKEGAKTRPESRLECKLAPALSGLIRMAAAGNVVPQAAPKRQVSHAHRVEKPPPLAPAERFARTQPQISRGGGGGPLFSSLIVTPIDFGM